MKSRNNVTAGRRPAVSPRVGLLGSGNNKLGTGILTFSLPARDTCPGRTDSCSVLCYATKGHFQRMSVKTSFGRSLKAARQSDFASRMISELARKRATVCRIHVSGDFWSASYTRAWIRIIRATPDVRFYAYTRSWRVPRITKALATLSAEPNVRLFFSIDRETGLPGDVPPRVRLAYLSVAEDDLPPPEADLVFRDSAARSGRSIRMNGVLVCPFENGTGWADRGGTCKTCGLCVSDAKDPRSHKTPPEASTRFPLKMVR